MSDVAVASRRQFDTDSARAWIQERGVYAAIVALLLYNLGFNRDFLTANNLQLNLIQMMLVLVTSLGMAMVIGTGGIDLSVGAVLALSNAFVAIYMSETFQLGTFASILMALLVGALVGLFNGVLVGVVGIQPIIATLPMFIGARAFAQFWAERQTGTIAIRYPESAFMENLG